MTDSKEKEVPQHFEIPRIKSAQAMLRTGNLEKLEPIAEHNDAVWRLYEGEVNSNIVSMVSDINKTQKQIRVLEEKLRKQETALYTYIIEHADELKKANMLSYDEYNNITLRLNKDTLQEFYKWFGKDAVISIFENIMPKDKGAQMRIIKFLTEHGYNAKDFLAYSNYKISDALKKLKSSIDPNEQKMFSELADNFKEGIIIRVSAKDPQTE